MSGILFLTKISTGGSLPLVVARLVGDFVISRKDSNKGAGRGFLLPG